LENRGDNAAHASDDSDQQADEKACHPAEPAVNCQEALIDQCESLVHSLLKLFQAPIELRFQARHSLADIVDSHRLLPDPAVK
jgi:hypothetical protein